MGLAHICTVGQHGVLPTEVNVSRHQAVERFAIALVVLVSDEVPERGLNIPLKCPRPSEAPRR